MVSGTAKGVVGIASEPVTAQMVKPPASISIERKALESGNWFLGVHRLVDGCNVGCRCHGGARRRSVRRGKHGWRD
jgi:hypothetical protein